MLQKHDKANAEEGDFLETKGDKVQRLLYNYQKRKLWSSALWWTRLFWKNHVALNTIIANNYESRSIDFQISHISRRYRLDLD